MEAGLGQSCRCWVKNKQNKPQLELSLISFNSLFFFLFSMKMWRTAVWIWQQRKVRRVQLDPLCNDITAALLLHDANDANDANDALLLPLSVSAAEKQHLLFGRPRVLQPDQAYCVLHQEGYITGYSHTALMPLWSSFTIDQPVSVYLKSCMYQVSRLDRPGLNIFWHRGTFRCCFCQTVQVQWKTDLWEFTFAKAWRWPTEISDVFTRLPLTVFASKLDRRSIFVLILKEHLILYIHVHHSICTSDQAQQNNTIKQSSKRRRSCTLHMAPNKDHISSDSRISCASQKSGHNLRLCREHPAPRELSNSLVE